MTQEIFHDMGGISVGSEETKFFSLGKFKEHLWASSNIYGQVWGIGEGRGCGMCVLHSLFKLNEVYFFQTELCVNARL